MTNLEEAKQYISSIQTLIVNKLNSNNYQNYVMVWNTWATIRTTSKGWGPAGTVTYAEPQPPQLMVFDQSAALAAFIAWSDAMGNAAEHGAKDPGTFDWLPFITFTQAAPLTLPAPPQAPSQLVGPDEGVTDSQGREMFYTVTGDHSPLGTQETDSRGTFLKVGRVYPFGVSAYWAKIS